MSASGLVRKALLLGSTLAAVATAVSVAHAEEIDLAGHDNWGTVRTSLETTLRHPAATEGESIRLGARFDDQGRFIAWADSVVSFEIVGGTLAWRMDVTYTFADNSKLFVEAVGESGGVGATAAARTTVTGGTGRFDAAEGSGELRCFDAPGIEEWLRGGPYLCASTLDVTAPGPLLRVGTNGAP